MAEPVAPLDAELVAVTALKAGLTARSDTAKVGTKVPNPRPLRMCRVSLVDSPQRTHIHFGAVLLVECWDTTELAAGQLARRAYGILSALADTDPVVDVNEVGGIANFPDPDVGPRYQFTLELTLRGELV
ncbi:hypothetical protein ACFPPE_07350 [Agromyces tardus]|uniref:hypothetical protein n=1 Tax=Agromyces tardus TaxID=2583849 RepID=UPI00360F09CC